MTEDYKICKMCSLLMTLLDQVEMASNEDEVLEITRQRFKIAEDMGLTVVFEGRGDSGLNLLQ